MFGKKKQPAARELPAFTRMDKTPVRPGPVLETIKHFAGGCEGEPMWNATGCRFGNGAVLLRTYPADRFRLFVPVGGEWLEMATIEPGDPALAELEKSGALVSYGRSPAEQRKQQEKEAEEARKLEEYRAYQRQRGEAIKAAREREAQRHGRAV